MDITEKTAAQIADAVRGGEVTAEAVVAAHFTRIGKLDGAIKAFLAVTKDMALEQARADRAEQRFRALEPEVRRVLEDATR